jgi:rubrerythrin
VAEKLFSDLEGLRIGMSIEDSGRDFYQQAYELAKTSEQKELFFLLKTEEISHYEIFSKLFHEINSSREFSEEEYLFDPDTSRYLTVLAEDHIFPKGDRAKLKLDEVTGVEAILRMAIQAEKDSILFYDELADKSKFEHAKKVFRQLKAEEQLHVVKLKSILADWCATGKLS